MTTRKNETKEEATVGESSTDKGESCESKFCKRVDELMGSSGIKETDAIEAIEAMKQSYINLERAIKQNLDKDDNDESQSKGTSKESDDLVNLSIALRAKRKDKKMEDSKKTKEVKDLP